MLGNGDFPIVVDGASTTPWMATQQNFSQEIVQEFQISSLNLDLRASQRGASILSPAAQSFHGSGFFRDHHTSAYPGPARSAGAGSIFARRWTGLWVGGPVIKDKLFFAAYEHNNQRGVHQPAERPGIRQPGARAAARNTKTW